MALFQIMGIDYHTALKSKHSSVLYGQIQFPKGVPNLTKAFLFSVVKSQMKLFFKRMYFPLVIFLIEYCVDVFV